MQGLAQLGVIDPQITTKGDDPQAFGGDDKVNGVLDLVEHGQHIARVTWIARGHPIGKDKAGRGLRHDAGLAAKLRGAVALAFEDGGNGGVIGIDDFALGKFFALGEALRLCGDVPMGGTGGLQIAQQTLALGRTPPASTMVDSLRFSSCTSRGSNLPFA